MDFQFAAAINEQDRDEDDVVDFSLNVTDVDEDGNPLEEQRFEQDDYRYYVTQPSPEMISIMLSDQVGRTSTGVKAASVWEFFRANMSAEDFEHLRERTLDKKTTGITFEHITQVMQGVIKEFSGFPTKPSRGSSPSPKRTGRPSTGRQPGPGSTRSRSASVAS